MIIVSQWINESREVRTSHLNLSEPCLERGGNSTVHRGVLAEYLCTDMPTKIDLCHACGNGKCSNPRHLYWGTRKENVQDAKEHGTFSNPWQYLVNKHGLKEAKSIIRDNGSKGWKKGGMAGKGKPKSQEHRDNLSKSLKKSL